MIILKALLDILNPIFSSINDFCRFTIQHHYPLIVQTPLLGQNLEKGLAKALGSVKMLIIAGP
jgi:hypothetical protein